MTLIERRVVDIPGSPTSQELPTIRYANNLLNKEDFDVLFELNNNYISFSISEKEPVTQYYFSDAVRHTSLKTVISGDPNPFDENWHTGQFGLNIEEELIGNAIFHQPPGKTEAQVERNVKGLLRLVDSDFMQMPSIPVKIGFGMQAIVCYTYFPAIRRLKHESKGLQKLNAKLAGKDTSSGTA